VPRTKLESKDVVWLAKKPAELEAFIEWKATPKDLRDPSSQRKLSRVLGVTERQINNWNRDPRVIEKISKRVLSQPLVDALPDVIRTVIDIASDPSNPRAVMAAKAYFDLLHRQSASPEQVDLSELSLAELKQHAADLYDALDEQEEATHGTALTA
jgi:hypothetical protein